MIKRKNIVLTWGTIYSDNQGVNALTYSALYLLELVSDNIGYKFDYILLGTQSKEEINDNIIINEQDIHFHFIPISRFNYTKCIKFFKPKYLCKLKNADYIFDLGQGDSFTDIYGLKRSIYNLWIKVLFRLLKKKTILLPQTIGPFKKIITRYMALYLLKRLDLVYVRDKLSSKYIDNNLPDRKYQEILDMAFVLPYEKNKSKKEKMKVGINISGLLWNGGYNKNNMFKLRSDYKGLMLDIINFFIKQNTELHLIAHVISNNSFIEDDYKVNLDLQKEYPKIIVPPKFTSPIDAKSYISNMDFFVGSRMHSCIAAFSAGIPVVPISYSRKFSGLFKETLKFEYVADAVKSESQEILNTVITCFHERNILKNKVETSSNLIEKRLNFLIKDISKYLKKK